MFFYYHNYRYRIYIVYLLPDEEVEPEAAVADVLVEVSDEQSVSAGKECTAIRQ